MDVGARFTARLSRRLFGLVFLSIRDDLVDDPVLFRLFSRHIIIALRVGLDFFKALLGMFSENSIEDFLEAEDFPGLDLDIGGLALKPAQGLVDENARVGQ